MRSTCGSEAAREQESGLLPKKSKSEVIADIHVQLVFPLVTTTSPQTLGETAATDDRIILAVQPFRGDPQFAERERGAENHPLRGLEIVCGFIEGAVVGVQLHTADPVSYTHLTLPTNREV